ncbi:MAG: hypothetical protein HFE75_11430 [Firmicutes bacterium]|nr:hypothetical protein [Bacillota bacterium]
MKYNKEFCAIVERVAVKYAKLVEKRIDSVNGELTGTELRDVYDGVQMLGNVTATLERLSRTELE